MLTNDTKINEVNFNTKYVSGQALQTITDFTNNTYIIKGSTGIGGTTALLNYTKSNCLIISPNVGMIKSKQQGKYKSDKQFFIYGGSAHKWSDVKDYLDISSNVIINTTPEQIIMLRSKDFNLYTKLIDTPVFIDEAHAYTIDTAYRQSLGEFMELIYNEWRAKFKLSTATPNYEFIDLPTDKIIDVYKISRTNEAKKHLTISNNLKDAKRFIQSQIDKKRLVVCFTNNINYHKSFTAYKVTNLVGQNLDIKLKAYKRGLKLDSDLYDNDIIFLSSSYYAGFDIDKDCSICIISEQGNEAYKIEPNNIVQAYGRCRATVYDSLFVNATASMQMNGTPIYYPTSKQDIDKLINNANKDVNYWSEKVINRTYDFEFYDNKEVTGANYVNRAFLMTSTLKAVNDYQLYNESVLKEVLGGYNFILSDYDNANEIDIQPPTQTQFKDRLKNLLELDKQQLYYSYIHIKKNLKYKDEGVFSKKIALEYLTAYLIIKTDAKQIIKMLECKRVYPNEFYNSVDLFFRSNVDTTYYFKQFQSNQFKKVNGVINNDILNEIKWLTNDWQYLYACHLVTNNVFPPIVEREIKLYKLFYNVELCIKYDGNKNRIRNTVKAILKGCIDNLISPNDNELKWLKEVVKSIYKALDNNETFSHNNSRKNIKSKMINALLYLLTNGKITDSKDVKNRQYNPITQLPQKMRCIIPIKFVSIDLTSANAQICDYILGTKQGLNVYQSLMNNKGISRTDAKVLYNSTLNNHLLSVSKAKKVYLESGYDEAKALELARLTANGTKGAFYEIMTANEKKLMLNYSNILPIKNYRFHDALIMKLEDVEINNVELTTIVNGYHYHVDIFNDGSEYNGTLTTIPNNGQMLSNYYYTKSSA
ncbi:hypothetical protein DFQ09_11058 [Winogradskyella pacifica]|uniref:Uncharacterized protein n=1 Tax=Winogradskyella pacifica TaxID=664642 RepID=A0A3D9LMU9_9FLAO|nr:DEAD/DEAH box helicase family protein [Winogradskyella pacifica]REE07864.1 hypothetical protein DFQ09_11058 [Winogradskyella pacifica]